MEIKKSYDYIREVKDQIDQTDKWESYEDGKNKGIEVAKNKVESHSDVYILMTRGVGKWYQLVDDTENVEDEEIWKKGFKHGVEIAEREGMIL